MNVAFRPRHRCRSASMTDARRERPDAGIARTSLLAHVRRQKERKVRFLRCLRSLVRIQVLQPASILISLYFVISHGVARNAATASSDEGASDSGINLRGPPPLNRRTTPYMTSRDARALLTNTRRAEMIRAAEATPAGAQAPSPGAGSRAAASSQRWSGRGPARGRYR
jgi:hypothetical protein